MNKNKKLNTIIDDLDDKNIGIKKKSEMNEQGNIPDIIKLSSKIDKFIEIKKNKYIIEDSEDDAIIPDSSNGRQNGKFRKKSLSIDVPGEFLKQLPDDFFKNEFGTIDLKEAEKIAEEDIHNLAEDDLFRELEMDIPSKEQEKKKNYQTEITNKLSSNKNTNDPENPLKAENEIPINSETENNEINNIVPEDKNLKKKEQKINKVLNIKETDIPSFVIEKTEEEEIINSTENIINDSAGSSFKIYNSEETSTEKENDYDIITDANIKDTDLITQEISGFTHDASINKISENKYSDIVDDIIDNPEEEINRISKPAEISSSKEKKIMLINNTEENDLNLEKMTLENEYFDNILTETADYRGQIIELKESDEETKRISGLIRDSYPSFTDLLKKPEKYRYFDDDIDFINNSIIRKDEKLQLYEPDTGNISEVSVNTLKNTSVEQNTDLSPEEINLIEAKLFNINRNNLNLKNNLKKIVGYDQPEDDIIKYEKYKYILPVRNSLKEDEKKSIEDDISGNTALIVEEDIGQIKLKLEDSMETIIKETFQDITDRIRIYEENKENGIINQADEKEGIKKLLVYLNDLLDRLPEDSIKRFAESEYYDLYKKVLNDLDK